ncbi:MAG: S1 RNA-binding domain-containing protein [Bryobacteraceae bacterium]
MNSLESPHNVEQTVPAAEESSFGDVLREFEAQHHSVDGHEAALEGRVLSVSADGVVVDVGRKMEGVLRGDLTTLPEGVSPGATVRVHITGRTEDGYYSLSTIHVERVRDLSGLQSAFDSKAPISGTVVEQVKGGLRVELAEGVTAFLPASRSGVREMSDLAKVVGQPIECRITKLDLSNPDRPDVVVDRRGILDEQAAAAKQQAFDLLEPGSIVEGRVRSLTEFGAFVELCPGIDGLLHVTEMSWQRVEKPSELLTVGQQLQVKILKISRENRKISLGLKQLTPDPWTRALENLKQDDRVRGKVVRLAEFGAFVEIAPGVDGLIHLSEMSWTRRVRKPSDVLQLGDIVEAVVLDVKKNERRISLGLKQALGNPWDSVETRFAPGTVVEGSVTSLAQFGAFVDLGDGVEGMIHVADITREKRIQHPKEVLTDGQKVKAAVLEVDRDKRRIRLSMKQLEPTSADVFCGEHQVGETLMGRVVEVHGNSAKIELAEGVHARCRMKEEAVAQGSQQDASNVTDLAAMLASRWKGAAGSSGVEVVRPGQLRRFRIVAVDAANRRVEVEFAE